MNATIEGENNRSASVTLCFLSPVSAVYVNWDSGSCRASINRARFSQSSPRVLLAIRYKWEKTCTFFTYHARCIHTEDFLCCSTIANLQYMSFVFHKMAPLWLGESLVHRDDGKMALPICHHSHAEAKKTQVEQGWTIALRHLFQIYLSKCITSIIIWLYAYQVSK